MSDLVHCVNLILELLKNLCDPPSSCFHGSPPISIRENYYFHPFPRSIARHWRLHSFKTFEAQGLKMFGLVERKKLSANSFSASSWEISILIPDLDSFNLFFLSGFLSNSFCFHARANRYRYQITVCWWNVRCFSSKWPSREQQNNWVKRIETWHSSDEIKALSFSQIRNLNSIFSRKQFPTIQVSVSRFTLQTLRCKQPKANGSDSSDWNWNYFYDNLAEENILQISFALGRWKWTFGCYLAGAASRLIAAANESCWMLRTRRLRPTLVFVSFLHIRYHFHLCMAFPFLIFFSSLYAVCDRTNIWRIWLHVYDTFYYVTLPFPMWIPLASFEEASIFPLLPPHTTRQWEKWRDTEKLWNDKEKRSMQQ